MPQEKLKEKELHASELYRSPRPTDLSRSEIEGEVAIAQDFARLGRAGTPEQCAKPRQELLEGERLDQIVVRPGVEPGDAVVDTLAR